MSNVLLIEDEVLISMMLEDRLADLGHCVTESAVTVKHALALLRETSPDFAVVDFQLADGACYHVIAALKRRGIPFVLVTGSPIDHSDARFADVEVLSKPIDLDAFSAVVNRLSVAALERRPAQEFSAPIPRLLNAVDG